MRTALFFVVFLGCVLAGFFILADLASVVSHMH